MQSNYSTISITAKKRLKEWSALLIILAVWESLGLTCKMEKFKHFRGNWKSSAPCRLMLICTRLEGKHDIRRVSYLFVSMDLFLYILFYLYFMLPSLWCPWFFKSMMKIKSSKKVNQNSFYNSCSLRLMTKPLFIWYSVEQVRRIYCKRNV